MRRFLIFSGFLFLLSSHAQGLAASPPLVEPDPFSLPQASILSVTRKTNIRVVYDVKEDIWDAGIGKGLYYVRGLLEAYKSQGVPAKKLKISVVLVHDAYTRFIDLQQQGYAYIRF